MMLVWQGNMVMKDERKWLADNVEEWSLFVHVIISESLENLNIILFKMQSHYPTETWNLKVVQLTSSWYGRKG